MSFFLDKVTDAIFIFLGVFFAFHFDQYQEDQALKRELDFNISEIMKTLPTEQPFEFIAPFEIKTEKTETGCTYSVDTGFESAVTGSDFLKYIKDRGLVRYVENRDLISILTVYYNDVVPNYKTKRKEFLDRSQEMLIEDDPDKIDDEGCRSKKEMDKWKKELAVLYAKAKVQDGVAQKIGHYLRKEFEKLGYTARDKNTYQLK